uniref:early nodulin-like protein 1 n=1 Tax=Erigeron canadensis TaxID=72917 RepID=UPI001CB90CC9|nr:early nodulin-like protein 1 [Erigeron canadensis]
MEHNMKLLTNLATLLVILLGFMGSCYGYTFYVGGKDGWVLDPRESYNHWVERNRFQLNDTLVFKYEQGMDSVLVVNQEAYQKCNKTSPKVTLNEGNSVFKFKRSGPFFFISGQNDKCEKGQKLIVVVMAVRHPTTPAAPTLAPVAAPSTAVIQGSDGLEIYAPVPAPAPTTSSVASTSFSFGGFVGLIVALSLGLISFVF